MRGLPEPEKRRRLVSVDETKVKVGGEQLYIWAARAYVRGSSLQVQLHKKLVRC
ncbi:MAG: hypothetical protein ACP5K8_05595 [Nitrososphaeria archaeon]